MTLQEITTALSKCQNGQFTKVHYETKAKNGFRKETKTLIRFVEYSHIKGVQVKGKANPNESHIIENKLIYNKNTNAYYLQMALVDIPNYRAEVRYFDNNNKEITKADYETANPKKAYSTPTTIIRKRIDDIIELGNE